MSVERLAVNAVSDRIAVCPRLSPEISSGDKTPITDGHIDFYSSAKKNNKTHSGRVSVQVKGRTTNAKFKASRSTVSFPVEREVLRFFREHSGGIYFYVPMRKDGSEREVFYAILLPFKIDRLLNPAPDTQGTFTVKLERLPAEPTKIERIIELAWRGRTQTSTTNRPDLLLRQAESFTIHSLEGINEHRPTRLALGETDFVLVAHLHGGLRVSLDIDFELLPQDYVERNLSVQISCGSAVFSNATGRRIDEKTHLIRLSSGLELRIYEDEENLSTNLNLTRSGSFRAQAKDFDFMIAAAAGEPMLIGETVNSPIAGSPTLWQELQAVKAELATIVELLDELGIGEELASGLPTDDQTRKLLLALHQGLIQDLPVLANSDGTGRYELEVGHYKILIVVMPADEPGFRRMIDPFDLSKRDRFQIYTRDESGHVELTDWVTVYESVTAEQMAVTLNLRLENLVASYEALENQASSVNKANLMVLRILFAADLAIEHGQRTNLLQGAALLTQRLLQDDEESLVHKINLWQILHRQENLSGADRREIRAARRHIDPSDPLSALMEACTLILLGDTEELEYVLSELSPEDVTTLQDWPIWALTTAETINESDLTVLNRAPEQSY